MIMNLPAPRPSPPCREAREGECGQLLLGAPEPNSTSRERRSHPRAVTSTCQQTLESISTENRITSKRSARVRWPR